MRVAAVQLNSTNDKDRNLETARRLVREAAAAGAELVALPEKWNLLAPPAELEAGAEELDGGVSTEAARGWAREHGIHVLAGSIGERVAGADRLFNTSALIDPSGGLIAVYRKIHMFDVEVGGVTYRESEAEQPGDEIVTAAAGAVEVGLSVCYDLRFPELYRILAVRGARLITVPSAFTLATGRDHWEVLLRARAIENQAFVLAPNQVGEAPPHYVSYGRSMIVDPWGSSRPGRRPRGGDRRRLGSRAPGGDPGVAAVAGQPAPRGLPLARPVGRRLVMAKAPPVDRRRQILDAAIRVFARQGFHACRVSDIAREAGVAYGLVYHYFNSKDQVLNELFVERWSLLLAAIEEVDSRPIPPREKLDAVAGFIIDSYRHDPELMKVIIVEVTRAANSFGRTHLPGDQPGLRPDREDRPRRAGGRRFPRRRRSDVRVDVVLRRDRAAALRLGVRADPRRRAGLRARPCDGRGHDLRRARAGRFERRHLTRARDGLLPGLRRGRRRTHSMNNEIVKRLMWTGLVAGVGALASVVSMRISTLIWQRVFGEDPPE